jgi:tetratricopeptide (TPR) repeat protein
VSRGTAALVSLLVTVFVTAAHAADPPAVEEGVRLFREGRFEEALVALTPAAEAKPPNATAIFYLGRIALARDDVKTAERRFEAAVALEDQNSTYHMWLGRAYGTQAQRAGKLSQIGLAGKTKAQFERASALDPENLDAREDLILYYLQAPGILGGSVTKAKEQAAEILKRDTLRGTLAYASVAQDQKDFATAERLCRSAVASFPDSLSPRYALGTLFARRERYDEAFAVFDSVLADRPDDLIARYLIGRTGAASGQRLDRAAQAMKEYIASPPRPNSPRPAGAHWRLGMIYEQQGRKDLAAEEYKKSIALDPGFADARKSLAKLK